VSDVFEKYPPGQWRAAAGEPVLAFPVISIEEGGGNRIVERERAYRDGSKLDDTGSKAKRWMLHAKFENTIDEPSLSAVNGSTPLYPDVLNALIDSFDRFHEQPGDLSVPTRGWVRARLEAYKRIEDPGEQDCADLQMTFVEDNEDSVDARAFTAPTANASARRLSGETTFDQQSDGIWGDDSVSLEEFAADLESWANAPGDAAQEVDRTSARVVGAANRILFAFSRPGGDGRDTLNDPEGSNTARKLHATKEIASSSGGSPDRGQPQVVSVVFERPQSLVTIAALLGRSFEDLLAANPQLDDPLYIPARTPVRVRREAA